MASIFRAAPAMMVGIAVAAAAFFAASSASAAPYVRQPTLSINTQTPAEGATVTLTGTDFVAGTVVSLTLHSAVVTLGTVTPNASGGFTTSVSLPAGVSGAHTIVGSGAAPNDTASVTITIGAPAGGTGGSGGGLSSTGVAVLGIGSVGVFLLAGGGVMLLAGRRRKVLA